MLPLEIERKFLIVLTEELKERCTEKIHIVQTYLEPTDPALQRRVRLWDTNGQVRYFYTEKRFLSAAVREENEREISGDCYNSLLACADKGLKPIDKTRMILNYSGQRFEIDVYPFSAELAIMELELGSVDDEIIFPPFVDVIKEVTGDKTYSNAALGLAGKIER